MEQSFIDERTGLRYELHGDYYLPCLEVPDSPKVGKFGRARNRYLKANHRLEHTIMELNGELNPHLEEVDRRANEMLDRLVKQYAAAEHITEELKANDQMAWVQAMNSIRNRAEEVVLTELIYC